MKFRNKIFLIVLISLLVLAVILIIVGYVIIGADILSWLTSRYAMWVYVGISLFLMLWLVLEIKDRIKRL